MTARTEWEVRVDRTLAEIVSGATTFGLYGTQHPRAVEGVKRLSAQFDSLLETESELAIVLLGEELFVQGRPFTRVSRHAPALARRLRRRAIEHATFQLGLTNDEVRGFLEDLSRKDDSPVRSRPHLQVGQVELSERELGGPDDESGGQKRQKLATVRDRVGVIHECFVDFATSRSLAVSDLTRVARALWIKLGETPDPFVHLAPWEGEERWPAVHAHNVAVLAMGLARFAGVSTAWCIDLALAGLVHDIGKLLLPPEVVERELELTGDELEPMFDHPQLGLAAVLAAPQLPPLAAIVTHEHHLNYNGTGYPRLARPRRPHPAARLVTVADSFVVLFTARAGRGRLTREGTLIWLDEHNGTVLDPNWAGALRAMLDRPPLPAQPPG